MVSKSRSIAHTVSGVGKRYLLVALFSGDQVSDLLGRTGTVHRKPGRGEGLRKRMEPAGVVGRLAFFLAWGPGAI